MRTSLLRSRPAAAAPTATHEPASPPSRPAPVSRCAHRGYPSLVTLAATALLSACGGGGGGSGGGSSPGHAASGSTTPPTAAPASAAPTSARYAYFSIRGLPPDRAITVSDGLQSGTVHGCVDASFTQPLKVGASYHLRIVRQPVGYTCRAEPDTTTVAAASATNLTVRCEALPPAAPPPTPAPAPAPKPVAKPAPALAKASLGYTLSSQGQVKGWSVATDGALSPLPYQPLQLPGHGVVMVMAPNNAHLYVLMSTSLQVLSVQSDGHVQRQLGLPLPPGASGSALAMTPDGSTLFVAEQGLDLVEAFRLDPATGAPSLLGAVGTILPEGRLRTRDTATTLGAEQLRALAPVTLLVEPSGRYLFIADTRGRIEAFRIQASTTAAGAQSPGQLTQAPDLSWRATIEPFSQHADGLLAVAGSGSSERLLALDTQSSRILQLPMPDGPSARHWKAAQISSLPTPHAQAIAFDPQTSSLYVASRYQWPTTGPRVRIDEWRYAAADGNGPTLDSLLQPATGALPDASIQELVVSTDGKTLYALDSGQHMIRSYHVQQQGTGNMLLPGNTSLANRPIVRGLLHAGSTAPLTSGTPMALVLAH